MEARAADPAVEAVKRAAYPLEGGEGDWDPLVEAVGEARFVLLGEATHGTHEFYRARARITRRLIREKGFVAVAVEADWPDALRVNRWVRGGSEDLSAEAALRGFARFPRWMWRNNDVVELAEWMREHNGALPPGEPGVGFYGIDLYSIFASIEAVIRYLDGVDPAAAARARARYGCFDRAGRDPQAYGYAAELGIAPDCREEAVRQLEALRRRRVEAAGRGDGDELFHAEQNARLVRNAEAYYRSMFSAGVSSWNLRDTHMADTIDALAAQLARGGEPAKVVVWAHNSHLGDSGATEMGERGEWNVGRLLRERHGEAVLLVGFTTHDGSVTAASDWDAPAERKRIRPSLPGSYEALFHATGERAFYLPLREGKAGPALRTPRLQRAIGVIYRPDSERRSHYFHASLPGQFDAVVHYDRTRALHPLERTPAWVAGEPGASLEPPETFPSGL